MYQVCKIQADRNKIEAATINKLTFPTIGRAFIILILYYIHVYYKNIMIQN